MHGAVPVWRGARLPAGRVGQAAGACAGRAGLRHPAAVVWLVHRDRGHPRGGCYRRSSPAVPCRGRGKPFRLFTLLVVVSVVLSAFIDNIPYVAAMLPVVQSIAALMNDGVGVEPYVFYFGLLTGATLGGNLTPSVLRPISQPLAFCAKRRDRHHPRLPAHRRALYAGRRAGRLCVPVAGVGQSLIF